MSNSQFNELKSGIQNDTEVTLKLSSNLFSDFSDETDSPHKILLVNTQVSRIWKDFVNNSLANVRLSKTQLQRIEQSGWFLGRSLGPLLTTRLPLIKNVLKPLAKTVLIPLVLIAAASATDAAINKKLFGSGMTALIISHEEINNIMKIVKFLDKFGLLIKGVGETIRNLAKEQKKQQFFSMSLGTLSASVPGNLATSNGLKRLKYVVKE